ncbi:hypothetical protein Entas_4511 (plasmid) [Enterobacter soli]|nr:hypothetical protein Entas_4511 [Enterobacter soli]
MFSSIIEIIQELNTMFVDVIKQEYDCHDSILSDPGVLPEVAEVLSTLSDSEVDKQVSINQLLFILKPSDYTI